MELFEIKDGVVTFAPEALELDPFRALWDRDQTIDKEEAVAELAFITFVCKFKSDFQNIIDFDERAAEVKKVMPHLKHDLSDPLVKRAADFYLQRQQTLSMDLLDSAKIAVGKIKEFFENVNLAKVDKNGRLVYNAQHIQKMIADLPPVVEGLAGLEKKVKMEQEAKSAMRGSREKSIFEDGELADD
jgi:hypothetical protein